MTGIHDLPSGGNTEMHDFAITVLLGLALFKIVDVVEDLVPGLTKFHTLVTMALAVGGVVAINYSLFDAYGIALRESWMGLWGTGFVVAGTTSVWRAAFHYLGSSEGEEPEVRHSSPRSMAA
jgi:hypothetical protein